MKKQREDAARGERPPPAPFRPRWGGRRAFTLALGLVVLVVLYLQLSEIEGAGDFSTALDARLGDSMFPGETGEDRFHELGALELRLLRRQRDLVDDLARRHVGTELTGRSLDDLRVIQEILDRDVIASDEIFALQALGVALGDVMAAQLGLRWVVVSDELGRSRALRLGRSDVLFFPVTMISKRVERGVPVRVDELYEKTARSVERARRPTRESADAQRAARRPRPKAAGVERTGARTRAVSEREARHESRPTRESAGA